ncbi:MAG: site-2 protease family protein [Deltaproteobacteria bacterium]|nr:site-2 protease family protein [Deltaproteobacteria bacterium]
MFGKRIHLFSLKGFEVGIDLSWVIIAVLVAWSLSTGFFPFRYKNLGASTYWIMGIVGAIGLFLSIIVHEFAHSLVARKFGLPVKSITLFIFGGVSEMTEEPSGPGAELAIAIVGPLSSFAIAAAFYGIYLATQGGPLPVSVNAVVAYLALINALLGGFNLIPAFPLDGGRVLRSILWKIHGDLKKATRTSSRVGAGFGIALIILGVLNVVGGNLIGGMWYVLIGLFLRGAANMSYQQTIIRRALRGEKVSRFMKTDPVTVPLDATIQDLVENYMYRFHHKLYPVSADGGRLAGCITSAEVKDLPRERWAETQVRDIASACSTENTIRPDADALEALSLMSRTGKSRLLVTEGENLVGVITMKDLMGFLSMKLELDQD